MRVVEVNLGKRSYQIFVERGSIEHVGRCVADYGFRGRCFLITNETVGQIYARLVEQSLAEEGFTVKTIEVEDSERVKSLCSDIYIEKLIILGWIVLPLSYLWVGVLWETCRGLWQPHICEASHFFKFLPLYLPRLTAVWGERLQ